tara:strand:- start:114 stop:587 length:474 start_codon:yes stop_codon:yes gene_type:complete
MAYDLENLMSDVKTIMVDNLNTKINDLNSEKSDSTTLLTVDNAAYFLQELDSTTINYNPFVFYTCEEIDGTGFGPNTPQEFLINCILILADQSAYSDIPIRMFRYLRAFKEIFEENFAIKSNSNFISINQITPVPLTSLNEQQDFRATGIQIRTSIG